VSSRHGAHKHYRRRLAGDAPRIVENRVRRANNGVRQIPKLKGRPGVDWKIELIAIPVTDVDRAKDFYVN
jgi:hypothetical protein